ncbi:MAG: S41 family peptidase [Saprospiraceae bacterium]|nr:S41 family peptidase [Saprospiraceae bacterium]
MDSQKKDNYKVLQPLLLSASMAIGIMAGFKMNDNPEVDLIKNLDYPTDQAHMVGRIEEVLRFVENKYVDKINNNDLVEEALMAVFNKLDPHSVYLSPNDVTEVADQMNGSFNGIGIENFIIDDTVNIYDVIKESPAEKSGLKAFDKIIAINDSIVAGQGMDFSDIRAMLRKEKGENVKVRILRHKTQTTFNIAVNEVPVPTVSSYLIPEFQTACIKIDRFGSKTYKEFMVEVEKYFLEVTKKPDTPTKAKHLILDLRDNPGGYLPEATNILCQLFEEKEKLLVYTEGRNNKKNEYKSVGKCFFAIDQIVVLIDENSASASEIVAGAIQDWDRGFVIGRRSFGKGLVQEQYDLNNGGAIRLTVARYFTPSGRSIQREYENRQGYEEDFSKRHKNGDLFNRDSTIIKKDSLKYYTLLLKRPVLASGGITPDLFIPMDSFYKNEDFLRIKSLLPEFTYRYVSRNKKLFPIDITSFSTWKIPQVFYSDFKSFIAKEEKSILVTETDLAKLEKEVKYQVIRLLYGKSIADSTESKHDAFITLASKLIRDKSSLKNFKSK